MQLTEPLTLPCGTVVPNRIAKSAMTEGLADASAGANERHARLYRSWSEGGAGLLVTGNVMVDWRYLERPGNVVIEDESRIDGLARWAEAGTTAGGQLWIQLNHAGRQCSRMSNARPVAPSAVQLKLGGFFGRPRALTGDEILDVVHRFARAAGVVQRAGFTGVQVHGAHGYLVSQFLSPRTNRRDDRWGGALENRARFLLETVRAVRASVGPDFPVAVKLNSADFQRGFASDGETRIGGCGIRELGSSAEHSDSTGSQRGGFELEDAARVAGWLAAEGIDLLEISGGTYERLLFLEDRAPEETRSTREREAFFLTYARSIRPELGGIPLMVTGGFRSRAAMADALKASELEMVGLARPLCVDPATPRGLLAGDLEEAGRWERGLRLGTGFLGPASSSKMIRGFNHQASVAWFYRQILALADGREPDTTLTARRALARHLRDELRLAVARRRLAGSRAAN